MTPCTALATKDFYSCDTEAGQVYVGAYSMFFFMILKLAEVRDCNDSMRRVVVILLFAASRDLLPNRLPCTLTLISCHVQ